MSTIKEVNENSSIYYYINEEKGVVIAKMNKGNFWSDLHRECVKNKFFDFHSFIGQYNTSDLTGKAVCLPEDTFDKERSF